MQAQKQRRNSLKIKPRNQKKNDNITYTTENTEQNDREDSTEKNGINYRVQNSGEIIGDKVPVEMTSIQTKAKQQENDVVGNKTSNK